MKNLFLILAFALFAGVNTDAQNKETYKIIVKNNHYKMVVALIKYKRASDGKWIVSYKFIKKGEKFGPLKTSSKTFYYYIERHHDMAVAQWSGNNNIIVNKVKYGLMKQTNNYIKNGEIMYPDLENTQFTEYYLLHPVTIKNKTNTRIKVTIAYEKAEVSGSWLVKSKYINPGRKKTIEVLGNNVFYMRIKDAKTGRLLSEKNYRKTIYGNTRYYQKISISEGNLGLTYTLSN